MKTFDFLEERGYVYQLTNKEKIIEKLNNEKITFYLGVDPTADSLHIGHFFALMIFNHLQKLGHKGILIIGGATALIPDPTGKNSMRKELSKEEVRANIEEVEKLCKRFIDVDGDNPAIILNNADWINDVSYVDFMREVGAHFNVNTMLKMDAYKNRLEEGGLTFLEMGYALMQGYDFVHLNRNYGCELQIGGSDQWSNILAGSTLARKIDQVELLGLTCPLLTNSEGKKMGKTEKGALWVASDRTSVYDFYQYWINIQDKDVETMLKLLSTIEIDKIKEMCLKDIREAKKVMAFEVTKLIHGSEEATKSRKMSEDLFEKGNSSLDMPSININLKEHGENLTIIDLLILTNITKSKGEGRRLVTQGGIKVNGEKVLKVDKLISSKDFAEGDFILQKGKKIFSKINIK